MGITATKQMLPLTILTTLCGIYTADCRNTKLRYTMQTYCRLISMVLIACSTAYLLEKVYTVELTYVSVAFLCMDIVSLITFIYYRLKYVKHYDVYNSIFENINYIDNCLQSVDIEMSSVKYQSVVSLYFVIPTVIQTCCVYTYFWNDKNIFLENEKILLLT